MILTVIFYNSYFSHQAFFADFQVLCAVENYSLTCFGKKLKFYRPVSEHLNPNFYRLNYLPTINVVLSTPLFPVMGSKE